MKKFKFYSLILVVLIVLCTGCKQDDMEDIDIIVTNYPNEFIISKLYGEHANIKSTYPDGVNISNYNVTKNQKEKYSNSGLFVYNGLIKKERKLAVDLLDLNNNLKIIDTAYVLEEDYSEEELWLNPSSLLMMAKNVQIGLNEYITSTYLQKEINKAYNNLKVTLSELDADYRVAVTETKNKTIVVNEENLKYLEKFGLTVICIDDDATDKELDLVDSLIRTGEVSYIYNFKGDELSNNSKKMLEEFDNVKEVELHKIDNLTDKEREDKKDYISLMNDNLTLLKQEMYQ